MSLLAYVAVQRMPDRIKALHILEALFFFYMTCRLCGSMSPRCHKLTGSSSPLGGSVLGEPMSSTDPSKQQSGFSEVPWPPKDRQAGG